MRLHPQDRVAAAAQRGGHTARRPAVAPVRNVYFIVPPWLHWLLRSFPHLPVVLLLPQPPTRKHNALLRWKMCNLSLSLSLSLSLN
jgi:hypothetical protein